MWCKEIRIKASVGEGYYSYTNVGICPCRELPGFFKIFGATTDEIINGKRIIMIIPDRNLDRSKTNSAEHVRYLRNERR